MNLTAEMQGERIRIRGRVQGVGFRPLVWRLASQLELRGSVRNDSGGVLIEVFGSKDELDCFVGQIHNSLPAIARIDTIERIAIPVAGLPATFTIIGSGTGETSTEVTPDIATCPDCLRELFDPANRRYRYPFINCTHCGPRFSIINDVPYDRSHTSMDHFTMCPACRVEYDDPNDRRFHAQPNACPACGPRLWLENGQGNSIGCENAIRRTTQLIRDGFIVAIKGIGGFHLACDATNNTAVELLRQRKARFHKPFALLARNVAMVRRYAGITIEEKQLLISPAAPIVLLKPQGENLAAQIAPNQTTLGFALASNPLHHLLMHELDNPIVLTSGNRSDEPQCSTNHEAYERLGDIADYFLLHNRDIVNRVDDSVQRVILNIPRMIRRARGYAPASLPLPESFPAADGILAMGAEMKSSFSLLRQGRAIISQHIGDLEHAAAAQDNINQLALFRRLFNFQPRCIAVDLHEGYISTQQGRELAQQLGVECVAVQHHHSHIAAVMAEHGLPLESAPVLGVALDGLGVGDDGMFWGGEFLLADYRGYRRLAHFETIPLPGGTQAIRQPWRNTLANLSHYFDFNELQTRYGELDTIRFLNGKPLAALESMMQRSVNSPLSSSCGRLFDAVAATLGICREQCNYEGQAAIELEAVASSVFEQTQQGYPFELENRAGMLILAWRPLWQALLDDLNTGVDSAIIAARFHRTMIDALHRATMKLAEAHGFKRVVLAGGVMQNRLLLEGVVEALQQAGFELLLPQVLPANDGSISLGQAVIAAARMSGRPG
jgi:hydrogenase maturation protein HypF